MANIFLDFTERKLRKMYNSFSGTLKHNIDFEKFVNLVCPEDIESTYTLYSPALEKRIIQPKNRFIVQNLVLIPQPLSTSEYYMPEGRTLMMQGQIECHYDTKYKYKFCVKSMQLIGNHEIPATEICCEITGTAKNALRDASWGKSDFSGRDYEESAIDMDVVESLFNHSITNAESAIATVGEWDEYLKFREYYIRNASSLSFHVDKCEAVKARMIRKEDYVRTLDDAPFLDGHKEFGKVKKDDFIYLNTAVPGDEECTVIKLSICEFKKDIDTDVYKRLRRLLRNQLQLCKNMPEEDDRDSRQSEKGLYIGPGNEIFIKWIETEIEPDYTALENECQQKLRSGKTSIEQACKRELEENIEKCRRDRERDLRAQLQIEYDKFAEDLDSTLESDIERNSDPMVIAKSNREAHRIAADRGLAIEDAMPLVDVAGLYRKRNEEKKKDKKAELDKKLKAELEDVIKKKRADEKARLEDKKKIEIEKLERSVDADMDARKRQLAADRTKRLTEVYLIGDRIETQKSLEGRSWVSLPYDEIRYDPMMDQLKINRQKETLEKLRSGKQLPNPMIAQYLFNPSSLPAVAVSIGEDDIEWENKRLNASQKDAVCKALSASGIFLIQGPPGTGKTTVIAEITAQLIKKNMRVLIASETHKAIDNAFEDIENLHLPQARLLRIAQKQDNKNTNRWRPELLTENFYNSIVDNLKRNIEEYEYFKEIRAEFDRTIAILRRQNSDLKNQRNKAGSLRHEITELTQKSNILSGKIGDLRYSNDILKNELIGLQNQIYSIEKLILDIPDDEYPQELIDFKRKVGELRDMPEYAILRAAQLDILMSTDPQELDREIFDLEQSGEKLDKERVVIKKEMEKCRDEIGDLMEDKEEEYLSLRQRLIDINNQINELKKRGLDIRRVGRNLQQLKVDDILDDRHRLRDLPQLLSCFKQRINDLVSASVSRLQKEVAMKKENIRRNKNQEGNLNNDLDSCNGQIKELSSDATFDKFRKAEREMEKALVDFFNRLSISAEYPKGNYDEALAIVSAEWSRRCNEFDNDKEILQAREGVLQSIRQYKQDGAIERDNKEHSMLEKLKDYVNIIGLTSTANYNNGDVDLDRMDIDVVIIDEVSKSSFLDLLRPMLYGKKVILVGDHMQLHPMYDLKHLRSNEYGQDDFDGLDENIITPRKNEEYTRLVQTCYFKELFENVPPYNKVMLDRQYRMHSEIMDINPFYHGKLRLGDPNLDMRKQHDMEITINGSEIISSDKHVLFVDCGESYESKTENSTSLINEGEADVVMALLHQIAMQTGAKNDLSVGVICTYGMQAAIIKRKMKNDKALSDLKKRVTERLIVSTVDDFQGDERDIIILSMVRNPTDWSKNKRKPGYNLDFIQEYQRINVAITRPRRLLIIVGAQDFLKKKALVDLPGENGIMEHDVPVFEKIISAINKHGRTIYMNDVVDTKEYKTRREYNNNKGKRK